MIANIACARCVVIVFSINALAHRDAAISMHGTALLAASANDLGPAASALQSLRADLVRNRMMPLPRVGLQAGRLDTGDRAGLVVVGGIAGDANGAEQRGAVQDQDAAGDRD